MKKVAITTPLITADVVTKALNEIQGNPETMKQILSNASYGVNVVKDQTTNNIIDFESLGDGSNARPYDFELNFLGQKIKVPMVESEYLIDSIVANNSGALSSTPVKKTIKTINVSKDQLNEVLNFLKDVFQLAVIATEDMEIDLRVLSDAFKSVDLIQEDLDATGTRRLVKPLIGRSFGNLYTGITNVGDANSRKAAATASGVEVFSQALLTTMLKSKLSLYKGMAHLTSPEAKKADIKSASIVSNVGFVPNAVRSTVSTIDISSVSRVQNQFENTMSNKYDSIFNVPNTNNKK